jgi:hypothetical protein
MKTVNDLSSQSNKRRGRIVFNRIFYIFDRLRKRCLGVADPGYITACSGPVLLDTDALLFCGLMKLAWIAEFPQLVRPRNGSHGTGHSQVPG